MQRYKSLVLPVALIAGYFLRQACAVMAVSVPYVIFAILILTFSGVRLASLRPGKLDLWIASFQTLVSLSIYWITFALTKDEVIAQGTMMCVLCPVASSVTVVASMLGADPKRTTTYTIVGNLLVAAIAPVYISLITDTSGSHSLISNFLLIFSKISLVIALPFAVGWILQKYLPVVNTAIASYKGLSFYLWAFALFVTIGQTADFVIMRWTENCSNVLWLGLTSLAVCVLQFSAGRIIGKRYHDRIAGGQLMGQKIPPWGYGCSTPFSTP